MTDVFNPEAIAHPIRFRLVSNRYPRRVWEAYGDRRRTRPQDLRDAALARERVREAFRQAPPAPAPIVAATAL